MHDLAPSAVDLDITHLTCPMTFVRVRLLLDRLAPGAGATIRLSGAEPHASIPRQLARLGHVVHALLPERPDAADPRDVWLLSFTKAG